MLRIKKILKILVIIILPISLQAFASSRNYLRSVKEVKVVYLGSENMYVTDQAIQKLLFKQPHNQIRLKTLDIFNLEQLLNAHVMVENSEIFHTIDGEVEIKVKQRQPIGRIYENGKFFYMDTQGMQMPLSQNYSARVPLVLGDVNKAYWDTTFKVLQFIGEDDFLSKNIIEIKVKANGEYEFRMRIPDFIVLLGKAEDLELKKANLKAFYKKMEKEKALNTYKTVNLKYANQVICIRN